MPPPNFTKEQENWIKELVDKTKKETISEFSKKQDTTEGLSSSVFDVTGTIQSYTNGIAAALRDMTAFNILDEGATQVAKSLGTTRDRLGEFKSVLAETIPTLTELGYKGSAVTIIEEIGDSLGTAASVGSEAITELAATSLVTGVQTKTLTDAFTNFGVSVYDVAENMKQVVDYTRSVGGNVEIVSSIVTENLSKLNVYNFDNGVKGLAKMAAESARFGINMGKIFELADSLFSPEKAIEMAAGLQRLGVTTSSLLDPLRLMDMAQNDPAELQKQIASMTKEFTQLNVETGKFEIKPGSMRRIREIAGELNISKEELTTMGLRAADFDRKLQEIEFPDFAASEEDKQLIASMAQMKEGKAVIMMRDEKTGIQKAKEVSQLTPEDMEKLKISQENQGKTMEQLAVDQLTTQEDIRAGINSLSERLAFGKAAAAPAQRVYETFAEIQRKVPESLKETGVSDFKNITMGFNEVLGSMESMAIKFGQGDLKGANDEFMRAFENLGVFETKFSETIQKAFDMTSTSAMNIIKEKYPQVSGVEAAKITTTKLESRSDVNMNVTLKSENLPSSVDTETIRRVVNELLTSPSFAAEIKKSIENMNSGLVTK